MTVLSSARDLRGALAGKKKTLRLVDDPRAADVQVIVDGRQGGELKTADEVANQVDRWLKFNRVRLMASRQRAANP